MGEYIPPSQLPINNPVAQPVRNINSAEISARRVDAQRRLPPMLLELFASRSDLIKIVDFARPSALRHAKPQRWWQREKPIASNETLIGVRLYSDSTETALFTYSGETVGRMIQIPRVHNYKYFHPYRSGYQDVPGIMKGYYNATADVLVTEDGNVRYPLDQHKAPGLRVSHKPGIVIDADRNCLIASLYEGRADIRAYEFAHVLMNRVTELLAQVDR